MSATDLGVVLVVVMAIGGLVLLALMWQSIHRTTTRVEATLDDFIAKAEPLIAELQSTASRTNVDLAKAEHLLDTAQSLGDTADSAGKLAYMAVANPVIKTVALASGTKEAARRLRKTS